MKIDSPGLFCQRELYDYGVGVAIRWDDELIVYLDQDKILTIEEMADEDALEITDDGHGNSGVLLKNIEWQMHLRFCRRGINGKTKIDVDFPRSSLDFDTDEHVYDYRLNKPDEEAAREAELMHARTNNRNNTFVK